VGKGFSSSPWSARVWWSMSSPPPEAILILVMWRIISAVLVCLENMRMDGRKRF